ncbi:MAG: hypothetical protein PVF13_02940 [Chromatiales bacterium]|jgi:hypothetical protein
MGEDTTGSAELIETECEALFVIREAEDLEEMTLACDDIDAGAAETQSSPPTSSEENEDHNLGDSLGMEFCVTQIQKAAQAVMEEARRLESEVERYVEQLLTRLTGDSTESSSTPQDLAPTVNGDEIVQEALAVMSEAERLQELVMRLYARIAESIEEDENEHD